MKVLLYIALEERTVVGGNESRQPLTQISGWNCLTRYAYQVYEFGALRRLDKAFTPHPA